MTDVGQADIVEIARKQLGLESDATVPDFYLNELKHHVRLRPKDINFRVLLKPDTGYDLIMCLEEGCGTTLQLIKPNGAKDGGKADGFGSLSVYRSHLSEHKALSRLMNKVFPKAAGRQPSQYKVPTSASNPKVTSATAELKSDHSGQNSSRKRHSDSALSSERFPEISKKLKADVGPKSPLSAVTNTTIPPLAPKKEMDQTLNTSQDVFFMLENIRAAIMGQENYIQLLRAKPFRSLEDLRNIQSAEGELQRLTALEKSYEEALFRMPSSSSSSSIPVPEATFPSHAYQSPSSFGDDFHPGSSYDYPMDVDATFPPSDPLSSPSSLAGPSSFFDSYEPYFSFDLTPTLADQNATAYAAPTQPPHSSLYQNANEHFNAPRASTSTQPDILRPTAPTHFVEMDQMYVIPRASSSKDPGVMEPDSADESDHLDGASDDEYPQDTAELFNRIGLRAPPPILDDAADENGDYYGRGRDLFDGPRAGPDDLAKFLEQAGNAEFFDGNQRVDDALRYLDLKNLNDVIPGMGVPLMPHQAMGTRWMVEKERSSYQGGCLADEMGLGKTIQTIATIVKNRPTNSACKTTLIVAPLALLDQWKSEIETKTNCGFTCLVYHGSSKTTSKKVFLQHDIVLTTFNTLAREWPDLEAEMRKRKKAKKKGEEVVTPDDEEEMKDFSYRCQKRIEQAGLLFHVELFRVVLDEAHYIRNRRTRIARAVTDIQATHRWCLTGTPIVNTIADAYSYIRFLKIRPWYDWVSFNHRIARYEKKRPDFAITRLHAVMSTFLLRRQKNTKLDGEPIIKLPEKDIKLVKLEFSKEERDVYNMVEARNQAIFNRYLHEGTVLKNYHHVLILLLRLRQICSHASLIAEGCNGYVQAHEADENFKVEFSNELTRARHLVSEAFVTKMKEKFKKEALARIEAEKSSIDASVEEEDCPICYDTMTDAVLTPCGHTFCRECIVNLINFKDVHAAGEGDAGDRGCPCCREPLNAKKLFSRSAFEPSDMELNPNSSNATDDDNYAPSRRTESGNCRKLAENDDDDDLSDFIVQSDEDENEKDESRALKKRLGKQRVHVVLDSEDEMDTPEEKEVLLGVDVSNKAFEHLRFLPSSKMKYMMNELQRLFQARPDEKTIVVSQWTSCLTLVSSYLAEQGILHVKYQGDMDRPKRDRAIKVFMSKEKARVMLMSLKCGGVGLNLTRANNVISLDLGWSFAVESQAFDRVHRVGQMRKVFVQRVVIADTVEDRILKMQERKQTFAEGALGEGSAKKMGRLSVQELANLFGLDSRGRVLKD